MADVEGTAFQERLCTPRARFADRLGRHFAAPGAAAFIAAGGGGTILSLAGV